MSGLIVHIHASPRRSFGLGRGSRAAELGLLVTAGVRKQLDQRDLLLGLRQSQNTHNRHALLCVEHGQADLCTLAGKVREADYLELLLAARRLVRLNHVRAGKRDGSFFIEGREVLNNLLTNFFHSLLGAQILKLTALEGTRLGQVTLGEECVQVFAWFRLRLNRTSSRDARANSLFLLLHGRLQLTNFLGHLLNLPLSLGQLGFEAVLSEDQTPGKTLNFC